MRPVKFEPTTPEGERPQTYALDRVATGTGNVEVNGINKEAKTRLQEQVY
jgi:hypothetical protein